MKLFEEGGLADDGARVEPVTGNEVPPGSMDQEVRDNVDAKLSEGEYVVPADVVRYYGVRFFEDLRAKAKEDFSRMESEGRIGGEPVDAQGVPMDNDELTPEEMQMLAEALGQAPQGMAMGGMVTPDPYQQQQMQYTQPMGMAEGGMADVPPFNPSQYQFGSQGSQQGVQVQEYINVETGETRLIGVLNGQPMGEVPAGFVLKTPETIEQARKNAQAVDTKTEGTTDVTDPLSPGNDSESDQRRREMAEQGDSQGGGFNNWASENYDKIANDPLGYVSQQLGSDSELLDNAIKVGAGIAMNTLGPAGLALGIGAKAYNELTPLSNARAAYSLAEQQGVDEDILKQMQTKIDAYEDALPRGLDLIDNVVAPGTKKFEALTSYGSSPSQKTETKLFVPSASKKTQTQDGAREEQLAQERYESFQKEYEENVKDAEKNQYGQTTGKGLTVEDIEDDLMPMAEGGLVAKPSNYKSKVTRKKEKKRRGLGSK